MQVRSHRLATAPAQVPVLPSEEIADLVKESEVRTGMPGRRFVIHGAETLTLSGHRPSPRPGDRAHRGRG